MYPWGLEGDLLTNAKAYSCEIDSVEYCEFIRVICQVLCYRKSVVENLLEEFKRCYESFGQHSLEKLDQIYAENVVFIDPLHHIHGKRQLKAYLRNLCQNLSECRFEFAEEIVSDNRVCFKWQMHYRHLSIKNNQELVLPGMSLISFSDKIDSHEDYYDMGAMVYEHIPLVGSAINLIKSRMVKE